MLAYMNIFCWSGDIIEIEAYLIIYIAWKLNCIDQFTDVYLLPGLFEALVVMVSILSATVELVRHRATNSWNLAPADYYQATHDKQCDNHFLGLVEP